MDETKRFLPLKPAPFHILLSLADGPRHGYAIRTEVEARTNGDVKLWPATLYGTVRQLTEAGLITELAGEVEADDDARRRYYELTALGQGVLAAEVDRLRALVEYAHGTRAFGRA
jgi:DNA-binding PadR family transcriptional regulator